MYFCSVQAWNKGAFNGLWVMLGKRVPFYRGATLFICSTRTKIPFTGKVTYLLVPKIPTINLKNVLQFLSLTLGLFHLKSSVIQDLMGMLYPPRAPLSQKVPWVCIGDLSTDTGSPLGTRLQGGADWKKSQTPPTHFIKFWKSPHSIG